MSRIGIRATEQAIRAPKIRNRFDGEFRLLDRELNVALEERLGKEESRLTTARRRMKSLGLLDRFFCPRSSAGEIAFDEIEAGECTKHGRIFSLARLRVLGSRLGGLEFFVRQQLVAPYDQVLDVLGDRNRVLF